MDTMASFLKEKKSKNQNDVKLYVFEKGPKKLQEATISDMEVKK